MPFDGFTLGGTRYGEARQEIEEAAARAQAEREEEQAYYDRAPKVLSPKTLRAALAAYPLEYDRLSREGREMEEPSFDQDLKVQAAVEKRLRVPEGHLEPALNHFVVELMDDPDCPPLEYAYGSFYFRDWTLAEQYATQVIQASGGDPSLRDRVIDACLLAGWSAAQQGELYRARRHFDNARERVGPDHARDFNRWTLIHLLCGELKCEQQLYAEAEKDLKALVGRLYRRGEFTNPRLHQGWRLLSLSLMRQGKYPEATKHLRAQHKLVLTHFSERHPLALRNRDAAVYALLRQQQYARAIAAAEELIELKKQIPGAAGILLTRAQKAQALTRHGRHEQALGELRELLPLLADQYGVESKQWLEAMGTRALALEGLGRRTEAERVYRRIITQSREQHGIEDPLTLTLNLGLAELLANLGRKEEARDLTLRVLRLRRKVLGRAHPATTEAEQALRKISAR